MNPTKQSIPTPPSAPPSRRFACKPDFDECLARIYAWYEQKIVDRPPVRFHHHNVEYERHRTVTGPWKTAEERWLDVEFQVNTFLRSLEGAEFMGETFPVFWPNLSAVIYNLFLGQPAEFDDVTAWTHPCVSDLETPPPLRVQWEGRYFRAVEALTRRALEMAEGRCLVGYTDMYAGIDCTAGLRGAEAMCLDMVERPKQLKELIEQVFIEYPAVYDHFDRCLKQHGQLSVTWMNLPWVQGIYGSQSGLRQVWVRMELQLAPGVDWSESNSAAAWGVPFFGSAALYYNSPHP